MSRLVEAKRTIGLLVLLMAAIVALSGPVAEVLDLPAPTAEAKKKHKKKKKKKNRPRPPAFNVVNCTQLICEGTAGNDFLVGTGGSEFIFGGEGNDAYQGNGGSDTLHDESTTSNDLYTGYVGNFGPHRIRDDGGSADFLDWSFLRALDDVAFIIEDDPEPDPDDLILDGPGGNDDVKVLDHFGSGRIEFIRFANGTITGTQAQSMAREATSEEQAALKERLPEEERSSSSGDAAQEEKKGTSSS